MKESRNLIYGESGLGMATYWLAGSRVRQSAWATAGLLGAILFLSLGSAQALAAPPTATLVSPNSGPAAGGASVSISGTGFIAGSTVKFGEASATGVTIHSSTSITASSPAGKGTVNVTVTNSNGTSTASSHDWFAYELSGPWLGLNGNSLSNKGTEEWLGPVNEFSQHNVIYDRSFELDAGEVPSEVEVKPGGESYFEERLKYDHEYGMIPVSPIEYKSYPANYKSDPNFPQARTKKEEEEGKNSINGYVEGFVKSSSAILKIVSEKYPGMAVLFEPINEPWGYTTPQYSGAEYAAVIAKLLSAAKEAGIPLTDIYVGAVGRGCVKSTECSPNGWVSAMYSAQSILKTEVQGWYFHPYGPPTGHNEGNDSEGIQGVPLLREKMTSGQNNIIISEVGYCDNEINKALESPVCEGSGEGGAKTAANLTAMFASALPYREAGWLKALIVYSRNAGGWAMQEYPSRALSKGGESLTTFANSYGLGWWGIQSTTNPSGVINYLNGVSCASTSQCTAVGIYYTGGEEGELLPFSEVWNGTTWSTQTVPKPLESSETYFNKVSCTASSACIAVGRYAYRESGSYFEKPWAAKWNGSSWSDQAVPGAAETELSDVSCTSSTFCIAVGAYTPVKLESKIWTPVVVVWNGIEWATQIAPHPVGAKESSLSGVSCTSSSACIAVGNYESSSGVWQTLGERWNGTEWSVQTTSNPAGAKESSLSAVSCASSSACVAVGGYENGAGTRMTLGEQWNGTEWSVKATSNGSGALSSALSGVACSSSTACIATGEFESSSLTWMTLAERWNGAEWLTQPTPDSSGARDNELSDVSCPSSVVCTAVGYSESVIYESVRQTLAERYPE